MSSSRVTGLFRGGRPISEETPGGMSKPVLLSVGVRIFWSGAALLDAAQAFLQTKDPLVAS
jgi:hypothetical protein